MDENNQQATNGTDSTLKIPQDESANSGGQAQNIFEDIQNKQQSSINNAPDPRLTINSVDDSGGSEVEGGGTADNSLPTTNYSENAAQPQATQQEDAPVATAPTG